MKVALIAATQIDVGALKGIGYRPADFHDDGDDVFGDYDADELSEFAGRNCYRSFDRPNPATRENADYLKHILDVSHESVLEHASATFYIEASRSVLTELERHRHLSFSVVSQRYVDANSLLCNIPPGINNDEVDPDFDLSDRMCDYYQDALRFYNEIVEYLTRQGKSRKQAREAARSVLPNMTDSPMVVTGNHRAWRYVIKARWHEAADAEIRGLAGELLKRLREIAPNCYQDIPDKPYSY
ncbi:ThyX-like thymidylate synthase [Mycobacterium phage Gaia]|uniref:ThyX-like thymidylate synthase n=1 Tax=Mycobacterium phage Gaia TaxID=1486472 RepID=A0A068F2H4_9CAUD|nr:thymidylate synthase [Mycobacterium phage Gaia]AID58909.1 ThyX-like thymidylate synthase [Mycobacterium phage Gaia]AYR00027.1 ThyX-like thymidylate synthase [Mycobacterium phage Nebkiss]